MKTDWKEMLSSLYSLGVDSKNFLFDAGLLDSVDLKIPVLSVGNLSVGGTGKTPVVQAILQMALEKGLKPLVVARNYGARSRGIHRIETNHPQGAAFYGDEAFMLACKFPTVPVWTGPKKYLTAQEAFRLEKADLVIVDDGFQHRSLGRGFDVVLLDATADAKEDQLLPQGRLREGFESLQRANLVLLTKVNWASPERVQELLRQIPAGTAVGELEFQISPSRELPGGSKVLALSGIAKPQVFESSLRRGAETLGLVGFEILGHLQYADHYDYQSKDVESILRKFRESGASEILTTEKDFVKLQVFAELRGLLNPMQVSVRFREAPSGLYEFLDRSPRH